MSVSDRVIFSKPSSPFEMRSKFALTASIAGSIVSKAEPALWKDELEQRRRR